ASELQQQKQKHPKKQTAGCWLGDLAKTKTIMLAETTVSIKNKSKMHQKDQTIAHVPVLLTEVLQYLNPREGDTYLDLTAGYGGHAEAVLKRTNNSPDSVLVDRDPNAVENLKEKFEGSGIEILNKDFWQATKELHAAGRRFDVLLADLGVSSPHLNNASRGFSLGAEGP